MLVKLYLTAEKVHEQAVAGEKVILVRHETSPEDIQGMVDCEGILTSTWRNDESMQL